MQQAADTEPLTLDEIDDKQQRAEARRQELMQQKLEAIQKNTQMLTREHTFEEEQTRNPEQEHQDSTDN